MRAKIVIPALLAAAFALLPGQTPDPKQILAAKVTELKQHMAASQAALRGYQWVEKTEMSLKGEVKKEQQQQCYYDVAGKLVKVAMGSSGGGSKPRGLRGRAAAKKAAEIEEYMDRVGSLVHRYTPPDGGKLQAAFASGNASITPGPNTLLTFKNYHQNGDSIVLTLNGATKKLVSYQVNSYLADPKDVVTMTAKFASLPDGTTYISETLLNAAAKEVQVKVANFGHRKAGG